MIEQVLTMKRTAALCLVGAFCSLNAQAQKIQVKGNLVDGTGEPLIGATVKVKEMPVSVLLPTLMVTSSSVFLLRILPSYLHT